MRHYPKFDECTVRVLKPEGTVGETWYTEKEFLDDYRQRFEEKRLRFAKTAP